MNVWHILVVYLIYLNCAHYSNCCLQFANIFQPEWQVRVGGGMCGEAWHFPLALVVPILRHSRHTMATQHFVLYINRCDEQNFGQLWGTFYFPTCLLSLLLLLFRFLLSLLLFPCLGLCVLFVLQFSSIILMQQICRRISCSKEFFHIFFFSVFFLWLLLLPVYDTHTRTVSVCKWGDK